MRGGAEFTGSNMILGDKKMSAKEIAQEIERQEEEKKRYLESQSAYKWLLDNVYANEEAKR